MRSLFKTSDSNEVGQNWHPIIGNGKLPFTNLLQVISNLQETKRKLKTHLIDTLSAVSAGTPGAVVNVDVAEVAGPARRTDTLVSEEPVHTEAVDALVLLAQVSLLLAPLPLEACRAVTGKVVHQVSALGAQQAGLFGAVVDVDLAVGALPAWRAEALVPALLEGLAGGVVLAGGGVAGVDRGVAVLACVAGPVEKNERKCCRKYRSIVM